MVILGMKCQYFFIPSTDLLYIPSGYTVRWPTVIPHGWVRGQRLEGVEEPGWPQWPALRQRCQYIYTGRAVWEQNSELANWVSYLDVLFVNPRKIFGQNSENCCNYFGFNYARVWRSESHTIDICSPIAADRNSVIVRGIPNNIEVFLTKCFPLIPIVTEWPQTHEIKQVTSNMWTLKPQRHNKTIKPSKRIQKAQLFVLNVWN